MVCAILNQLSLVFEVHKIRGVFGEGIPRECRREIKCHHQTILYNEVKNKLHIGIDFAEDFITKIYLNSIMALSESVACTFYIKTLELCLSLKQLFYKDYK